MLNPAPTSPTTSTPEPDTSTVPQDAATIPSSAMQAPTGKGLELHPQKDCTVRSCSSQEVARRSTPISSQTHKPANLKIPQTKAGLTQSVSGGKEARELRPAVHLSILEI